MQLRTALRTLGLSAVPGVSAGLAGCTRQLVDFSADLPANAADIPRQVPSTRTYPVAWVLSSGGPRGFAHVGVLKALVQLGLKPDLVVGSSVGALVGCLYAGGMSLAAMEKIALETDTSAFFRLNLAAGAGWLSAGGIADFVRASLHSKRLQELPIAFAAVAAHPTQDQLTVFNFGDAGLAVQAACAMEGRLAPVRLGTASFVDADRLSPLPVRSAHALGAVRVLGIDVSAYEHNAPASAERFRASDLRKRALTQADARLAQLVLHPETDYYASTSRDYRERLIRIGYETTLQQASALVALHAPPAQSLSRPIGA